MTRLEKIPLEEGKGFRLVPKTDWSDHYRVADDQMFVEVANADTRDKLPVDVQQAITLRVNNPYMTAYNTGRNWAIRAMTSLTDAINTFTRKRTADQVVSIKDGDDEREFSKAVMKQANKKGTKTTGVPVLSRFGVEAIDVALLKNDLDPETQNKLQDEAIAAADARAREHRGRGEAAATGHVMDAVIQRGEKGAEVFMAEARIRQAEAAGKSGGTVILDSSSGKGAVNSSIAFLHESMKGNAS